MTLLGAASLLDVLQQARTIAESCSSIMLSYVDLKEMLTIEDELLRT